MARESETTAVQSAAELRQILGEPSARAAHKARPGLHPMDRQWLAHTSFCLLATADASGRCDVSPRGDPPGFVHVIDDHTIAIPDRPGNKRADSLHNILSNPHVGLICIIPGRNDTLRINGRARILRSAPYLHTMVVNGHQPQLALEVAIDELFYHCAKAFMRSELWAPESWQPRAMPSRPEIVMAIEAPDKTLAELEAHYGPAYAKGLYADPSAS